MSDYDRIKQVIEYLDSLDEEQPDLGQLAARTGLSKYHFQRVFVRWAGVTPKEFMQCLGMARAKAMLREGQSVLDVSYQVGLSGPGRLHDLCVRAEAASPGEIKSGGKDWQLQVGQVPSPFGWCLIAQGPRGVCHLSFADTPDHAAAESVIKGDWPGAQLEWDNAATAGLVKSIMHRPSDASPAPKRSLLRIIVKGTEFQVKVWKALLKVPFGSAVSYGQLADSVGVPGAARAVGSAVGRNALAYLIPCHRVIRSTGVLGDYRWGAERKRAMLGWEASATIHGQVHN